MIPSHAIEGRKYKIGPLVIAMPSTNVHAVLVTAPDEIIAKKIAEHVVQNGLAACVNIITGVRSIYRWEGEIQDDTEVLLIAKTTDERFSEFERAVHNLHPYDTPEIISIEIAHGLEKYLTWVRKETGN